jgi:uncharacterized coiled-coil protein SlyX
MLLCAVLQEGSSPDVWLQLLERYIAIYAADPAWQCTTLRSLAQQLGEQRSVIAHQQQQIASLQQQVSDQQRRLLLQEQVDATQQQLIVVLKKELHTSGMIHNREC